jgi:DNA adenine methylase
MQYMGGKTRIAKQIAVVIDQYREPGQLVWDAFCGGLSVSVALSKKGPVLASDACLPLISMQKAFKAGWSPALPITKEIWEYSKSLPDTDPLKGFCGFGCSYCGIYFTSFGKEVPGKYEHIYALRTLKRDTAKIRKISLIDFLQVAPRKTKALIYCDPPYKNTTPYEGVLPFDYDLFLTKINQWSFYADVFVSEYDLPIGNCIWSSSVDVTISGGGRKGKKAVESLYHIPKGSM